MSRVTAPIAAPGAHLLGGGRCAFRVWAPAARRVDLKLLDPDERLVRLEPAPGGWHHAVVDEVTDGTRYCFRLDGAHERPDPASRAQPQGVHGASAVVRRAFEWSATEWRGRALEELIIYEVHVGAFTADGTLDAAAGRLEELHELGVSAVELMPVAAFPGTRNWGYDGVYPFAVHQAYGGAAALKRFVDRAHALGIAVILDVVYNHLGPEGNYLADFGPYFSTDCRTPWGDALNFDGPDSDAVRGFFIANALQWIDEFRIDGLRLDAVHAIFDRSARPFLRQLARRVRAAGRAAGRTVLVIAESDLADPRMVRPASRCGLGMDAQWLDDFHHALHARLTGERDGYYADFGGLEPLARCFRAGFVLSGQYSKYRRRRHGAPSPDIAPARFVVYAQNHDQVGNRAAGDRLTSILDADRLRLAAATTLLSPFTPLLFMGEEYGDTAPFPYFVSHGDAALVEAVRRGRRAEFAAFGWSEPPPDPQDIRSFEAAKLSAEPAAERAGQQLRAMYRELIALRRELPRQPRMDDPRVDVETLGTGDILLLRRSDADLDTLTLLHFGDTAAEPELDCAAGDWTLRFDSADRRWGGAGSRAPATVAAAHGRVRVPLRPRSAALLTRSCAPTQQ